jgi:D-xylose transport system substrate-binding protein
MGEEWKDEISMKLFRRKGLTAIIGVMLFSVVLAACGAGGGTTTPSGPAAPVNGKGCTKVGILLPETATSARWDGQDRPLLIKDLTAVVGSGGTVDYNNAQGSASTQQSQAEAALTKGDCILVLAPSDAVASAAIVAKAKAQNVPVIAYDRLIQSNDLTAYVSFDGVAVGAQQGGYIADHYKDFTKSGTNVVMINGSMTDNNALLFSQGAHSKLDPLFTSGALKKVYEQFTPNWDNATAQTEMEAALTANHNNIQIAYVANDGMANSVIAALKAQKLNGKILVTGQDATVAGIHNILVGDQSMTVYKAIAKEAQASADVVKALIAGSGLSSLTNGATVKNANGVAIPAILEAPVAVDKTNIATTVIADGFVSKSDVCQGVPAGTDGVC